MKLTKELYKQFADLLDEQLYNFKMECNTKKESFAQKCVSDCAKYPVKSLICTKDKRKLIILHISYKLMTDCNNEINNEITIGYWCSPIMDSICTTSFIAEDEIVSAVFPDEYDTVGDYDRIEISPRAKAIETHAHLWVGDSNGREQEDRISARPRGGLRMD